MIKKDFTCLGFYTVFLPWKIGECPSCKVVGREVTRRPCAPLLVRASKRYSTGAKRLLRRAHYGAARQEHRERVPRSAATAVVRARGHADIEGAKEQVQCTSCS